MAERPMLPVLLLRAMRPRQWVKNILLFAGLFLSKNLFHRASDVRALAAFACFCAIASAIYLLNDLIDAPRDRLNPRKSSRPIASGDLPGSLAKTAMLCLGAGGLGGAYLLSRPFGLCATAYVVIMTGYCLALKHVFLIDAMIVSLGFVIRAVAGVIVLRTPRVQVPLTSWFVVCVVFLSLFLALCKRRAELVKLDADATRFRPVLGLYTVGLLDLLVIICATASIIAYTLYAATLPNPWSMLATLPFVIYGLFRYVHLALVRGDGEAPEDLATHDYPLIGCVVLWIVALAFNYL
jgi:4-hydroxybenzoate polyprenyltransferase